jgi:acyl-coenzyme A thioesterase PaaI-like protein
MSDRPVQDFYPDELSYCYGCGRLNTNGLHIQSFWDGEESVCHYTPRPEHIAIPGYVYGGLIASLVDCHGTGTAAAAAYQHEGRRMDTPPANRFVTASLQVNYLKPTPLGETLELRARATEVKTHPDKDGIERVRKVVVEIYLNANGQICAHGQIVAVQAPQALLTQDAAGRD